jgi:IS6 family transposase
VYLWVQRFAPEFAKACERGGTPWGIAGTSTYLRIGGTWRYLFRAIDQYARVIDVYLSPRRDANAARRFFAQAIDRTGSHPSTEAGEHMSAIPIG